jgi:hypothetical protein
MLPYEIWEEIFSYFTVWTLHPLRAICSGFNSIIKERFSMKECSLVDKRVVARSLQSIIFARQDLPFEISEMMRHHLLQRKLLYLLNDHLLNDEEELTIVCYRNRTTSGELMWCCGTLHAFSRRIYLYTDIHTVRTKLNTCCFPDYGHPKTLTFSAVSETHEYWKWAVSDIVDVRSFLINSQHRKCQKCRNGCTRCNTNNRSFTCKYGLCGRCCSCKDHGKFSKRRK